MNESLFAFVRELPKVELHLHLVGALPLDRIADPLVREAPDLARLLLNLKASHGYRSVNDFGALYQAVNNLLHTHDDFASSVTAVARNLATQNVSYAEISITPLNHLRNGVRRCDVMAGLEAGRVRAEMETGVKVRWCVAATGRGSVEDAEDALDFALAMEEGSVVSFGIGGPEVPRRDFAGVFRRAKEAGFHLAPHAGERCGPDEVWSAIVDLGAERIGHGIRSVEDAKLVKYLRDHRIPLEVCPTSNVMTGIVPSIDEHPVGEMLSNGLIIVLNSDDPTLFATDLTSEYYLVAETLQLDRAEVINLARNSIAAAFIGDTDAQPQYQALDSFDELTREATW